MMRMMTDKNTFVLTDDDRRFIKTARKILANEKVQQMKQYVQHGDVSTYEHCPVSYTHLTLPTKLEV